MTPAFSSCFFKYICLSIIHARYIVFKYLNIKEVKMCVIYQRHLLFTV